MRNRLILFIVLFATLLGACNNDSARAEKKLNTVLSKLHIGMTDQEVVDVIGVVPDKQRRSADGKNDLWYEGAWHKSDADFARTIFYNEVTFPDTLKSQETTMQQIFEFGYYYPDGSHGYSEGVLQIQLYFDVNNHLLGWSYDKAVR